MAKLSDDDYERLLAWLTLARRERFIKDNTPLGTIAHEASNEKICGNIVVSVDNISRINKKHKFGLGFKNREDDDEIEFKRQMACLCKAFKNLHKQNVSIDFLISAYLKYKQE